MGKALIPLMLALGLGLAVYIGERMSTDAMAVVIGVAVGVAASVPASLLLVALLRRERTGGFRQEPVSYPQQAPQLTPPAAIILDSAALAAQMQRQMAYTPMPLPTEFASGSDGGLRRLRVVGLEDES